MSIQTTLLHMQSSRVNKMSCSEGVGSPDGWLCTPFYSDALPPQPGAPFPPPPPISPNGTTPSVNGEGNGEEMLDFSI